MNGLEVPELHVEGTDDQHTIIHLLERHGIDMGEGVRPIRIVPASSVDQLLEQLPGAVKAATSRSVGFVLDIDVAISDRWESVCQSLRKADVEAPAQCPAEGFIGSRKGYPYKVGVWLMPDCSSDRQKLEDLLKTLIPDGDALWPHARSSTEEARRIGAPLREVDIDKAEIHCWLAWQSDPGRPYGTAIKAKFFGHDSTQARAFLGWLSTVFGIALGEA